MSEFSSQGFHGLPPLSPDLSDVTQWPLERLEADVNMYGHFLQDSPMPRAARTANHILDHLLFELGSRDGIYTQQEDELCDGI